MRKFGRNIACLMLVLPAFGFGAPIPEDRARTERNREYSALRNTTVGRNVFLLLSDGERDRAIRLCELGCRLNALDSAEVVPRIEREMQQDAESRLPYLESLETSDEGRREALHEVPYLAINPAFRNRVLERLERLRAESPTDLHVVWAHFRALLNSRRFDDGLEVARELELACVRSSSGACSPADGLFLEYALHATRAEWIQWLADDSASQAERFEEVRPHLERAIEAAARLESDYVVPRAFESGYSSGSQHPLLRAKLAYADADADDPVRRQP